MPEGGRLILETENVCLDDAYCHAHDWTRPGQYVRLSVTDTGCGMDADTLSHVFEPFFTTKVVGKGTGLGLSTGYGIVKPHDGFIHAYSEVGKGTTFRIYLHGVEQMPAGSHDRRPELAKGGTETVLLAEDEELVRGLAKRILENAGYEVLTAADGNEAPRMYRENADKVDLLLLDVVMPQLGGGAVYNAMRETTPSVRCLFASGYTENAIHTSFITEAASCRPAADLDAGVSLIQKPYHPNDLLRAVRRVLDS